MEFLVAIVMGIGPLLIILSPFFITWIKKKRQIGKLWSAPLKATVKIAGETVSCKHCKQTQFYKREGILVTSWVAFFRFSFWNQSAACYTCVHCGCVEWFVRPKEEAVEIEKPRW